MLSMIMIYGRNSGKISGKVCSYGINATPGYIIDDQLYLGHVPPENSEKISLIDALDGIFMFFYYKFCDRKGQY